MARVRPPAMLEKNLQTKAIIDSYMTLRQVTDEDVAKRLPRKKQTFQNKKNHRQEIFNLWEIRIICDYLKIPPEERVKMI